MHRTVYWYWSSPTLVYCVLELANSYVLRTGAAQALRTGEELTQPQAKVLKNVSRTKIFLACGGQQTSFL